MGRPGGDDAYAFRCGGAPKGGPSPAHESRPGNASSPDPHDHVRRPERKEGIMTAFSLVDSVGRLDVDAVLRYVARRRGGGSEAEIISAYLGPRSPRVGEGSGFAGWISAFRRTVVG